MSLAVVLGFGHPLPDNTPDYLAGLGYTEYRGFTEITHFNLMPDASPDLYGQVIDLLIDFSFKVDGDGTRVFDLRGDFFLLVPGVSGPAALIATALTSMLEPPPTLLTVALDPISNRYHIAQQANLKKWGSYWRSVGRAECTSICQPVSGVLTGILKGDSDAEKSKPKPKPKPVPAAAAPVAAAGGRTHRAVRAAHQG